MKRTGNKTNTASRLGEIEMWCLDDDPTKSFVVRPVHTIKLLAKYYHSSNRSAEKWADVLDEARLDSRHYDLNLASVVLLRQHRRRKERVSLFDPVRGRFERAMVSTFRAMVPQLIDETEPCVVAALVEFGLERTLDVLDGLVPLPELTGIANGLPEVAMGMDVCYRTALEWREAATPLEF